MAVASFCINTSNSCNDYRNNFLLLVNNFYINFPYLQLKGKGLFLIFKTYSI